MYDVIKAQLGQSVPFANTVGVEMLEVGPGVAQAALTQRPDTSNHVGSLHAGALFTLGEAASGGAMAGMLASQLLSIRPLAAGSRISYRRIAKGRVVAAAKVVELQADVLAKLEAEGRTTFGVDVIMSNDAGEEVATMQVDWHVSKRS